MGRVRRRGDAGEFAYRGGGEASRPGCRLDAPGVQAAVGPAPCDDEVVEAGISRPDAVLIGAGERLHIEVRWIDVGSPELVVQSRRPVRGAGGRSIAEQLPAEALCIGGARPQDGDMAVKELAGPFANCRV